MRWLLSISIAVNVQCKCALSLCWSGCQSGCSNPAQDKPSKHSLHSWYMNAPLIDLNEAAAGLLVGWEPLCQHRTVNGKENVAYLPSSLLFLFPMLPTMQDHCFLALGCWLATVARTNTLQEKTSLCRERLTKHSDVTASECQGHLKAGRWLGRQAQLWEARLLLAVVGASRVSTFWCGVGWIDGCYSAKLPKTWIADGSTLWKSPWAGGNHPRCPFRLSPPASQRAE